MNSPPSILTLPPEIVDIIANFLLDDKGTLANMSLVCRSFLFPTRRPLFKALTISVDKFWEPMRLKARVSEIVDIFTSFASLVRHLRLSDTDGDWGPEFHWIRAFLPCLSVFKAVTSLSLPYFNWQTLVEARNELFACFSGVLELIIEGGCLPDAEDILMSALQFPLLERLRINSDDLYWRDSSLSSALVPVETQAFSNLSSLTIGGDTLDMRPILYWFSSLEKMPSLRTLHIRTLTFNELEPAGRFIRALTPTLKHLRLEFLASAIPFCEGVCQQLYYFTTPSKLLGQKKSNNSLTLVKITNWNLFILTILRGRLMIKAVA
jgi:hypothetical protein